MSGPDECEITMKTANHRRTPASNTRAHADLEDCLTRKLQHPDFRTAYVTEDKRIELVLQNHQAASGGSAQAVSNNR